MPDVGPDVPLAYNPVWYTSEWSEVVRAIECKLEVQMRENTVLVVHDDQQLHVIPKVQCKIQRSLV